MLSFLTLLAMCILPVCIVPAEAVHALVPTGWVVAVAANATVLERRAANELAYFLGEMLSTDAATTEAPSTPLPVVTPAAALGRRQFGVGTVAAVMLGVDPTQLSFAALGLEGFMASSNRTALLTNTGSFAVSGSAGNESSGKVVLASFFLVWYSPYKTTNNKKNTTLLMFLLYGVAVWQADR